MKWSEVRMHFKKSNIHVVKYIIYDIWEVFSAKFYAKSACRRADFLEKNQMNGK